MTTQAGGAGPALDESGRPYDQIRLAGISATGFHGVFDHERREGQTFRADVVVHLDTRRAAAADDLTRTVDYGVLAAEVAAVLAGDPANLIETVAERIAATALAHPAVVVVDVAVHKPQAPVTVPFDDIVVTIRRDHNKLPAAEPWTAPTPDAVSATSAFEAVAAAVSAAVPGGAAGTAPASSAGTAPAGPAATASRADAGAEQLERDRLEQAPPAAVEVVLALGSNQGASQDTLRRAVAALAATDGLTILTVSPLARTAPVGGPDQPDFLNAVVIAHTTLSPRSLLRATQEVEAAHGRERLEHWGPRTLDIDIIVYGTTLAVTDDLELPHPLAHQRAFVLQPWAQIAPDAVLPGLGGGPVAALAATAPDRDGIRWLALDWLSAPPHSTPEDLPTTDPASADPVVELDQDGTDPDGTDPDGTDPDGTDPAQAERDPAPALDLDAVHSGAHALPTQTWLPDPPPPARDDRRS